MRKHVFGRKLKRDVHERNALFKSLLSELVLHERIQSTEEKIKAIKADADKLITKAKYEDRLHAYALLQPMVSAPAVTKLLNEIAPRFVNRQGGYTRVIKINRRFNDNARMAMIEWTETKNIEGSTDMTPGKKTKKTEMKQLNASTTTSKNAAKSSSKNVGAKTKTTKVTVKKATKKEVGK